MFPSESLGIFRYIKIVQLQSRTFINGAHLAFYELELYGSFFSGSDIRNEMLSCKRRRCVSHGFLLSTAATALVS